MSWLTSSATEGFKRTTLPDLQGMGITTSHPEISPSFPGLATSPLGSTSSQTSRLDLAINGTGLFQIKISEGETVFTRRGSFSINSEGVIVDPSGSELHPRISLPSNRQSVTVASNGEVSVLVEGSTSAMHEGSIQLAEFVNVEGLEAVGMNQFRATEASGTPIIGTPGTNGLGTIVQSSQGTTADEVEGIVDQIAAERQYEQSSSVIRAPDDLVSRGPALH